MSVSRRLRQLAKSNESPIQFDEPTFIRMLEWSREDAPGDEALHIMMERLDKLRQESNNKIFTMADYPGLVAGLNKKA
jgi:hypothetical protein